MNKLIILIALILIVGSLAGFMFLKNQNKNVQDLVLYKDTGSIMYKTESGNYTPVDSDKKLVPNHSFIKTGTDGLAHLILPDKSMISLSQNSEMQVNYDSGTTKILQTLGNAWFRIQKLAGKNDFTVETSTTVATVRGTIFAVESGKEDVVYVTESSVEIAQLKDQDGKKTKENVQTLTENKLATITKDQKDPAKIVDIPEEKKNSTWFKRNQIIDKEFKQGINDDFVKKIHENSEIKQLNQTLDSNIPSTGLDKFADYSWIQNGQQACTYINSAEYLTLIDQLKSSGAALGAWGDWLIQGVNLAKDACKDGTIDANEALKLQNYYKAAPQPPTMIAP